MTPTQARAAAAWWAEQMRRPTFQAIPTAERNPAMELSQRLAAGLNAETKPSDSQIRAFERELELILLAGGLVVVQDGHEFVVHADTLSVDYAPDHILAAALTRASCGKVLNPLPWKTTMQFANGGVRVVLGYGGAWQWIVAPTVVYIAGKWKPASTYWRRREVRHVVRRAIVNRHSNLVEKVKSCAVCGGPPGDWVHNGRTEGHAHRDGAPRNMLRLARLFKRVTSRTTLAELNELARRCGWDALFYQRPRYVQARARKAS